MMKENLRSRMPYALPLLLAGVLVTLFLLAPAAALAKSGTYVFDEYGLFNDSDFQTLEEKGAEASSHGIGVYLLVTDTVGGLYDASSKQRDAFCEQYYREHDLGLGDNKDGVLFLIAVKSRDYDTWGNGLPWTEALSKEGIAAMEEDVTDYLHDNRWYEASCAYFDDIGSQLSYYANHGKAQVPLDMFDWLLRIFIVVIVPLLVAGSLTMSARSAMLTARKKTEAGDYLQENSLVVTQSRDRYLHTTHVVTPLHNDDHDGGGWGGGGSSGGSGGGKF